MLTDQVWASMRATFTPGTMRSMSGMLVEPDRRMSSCVIKEIHCTFPTNYGRQTVFDNHHVDRSINKNGLMNPILVNIVILRPPNVITTATPGSRAPLWSIWRGSSTGVRQTGGKNGR